MATFSKIPFSKFKIQKFRFVEIFLDCSTKKIAFMSKMTFFSFYVSYKKFSLTRETITIPINKFLPPKHPLTYISKR